MDTSEFLANYYDSLLQRCGASGRPLDLPHNDRVIYYVISTRCEMDMNGFESVFDQLLSEEELLFLIKGLQRIEATKLAEMSALAHARLNSANYFDDDSTMVCDLNEGNTDGFLDDLDEQLREHDELWELDARLVELIRDQTSDDR